MIFRSTSTIFASAHVGRKIACFRSPGERKRSFRATATNNASRKFTSLLADGCRQRTRKTPRSPSTADEGRRLKLDFRSQKSEVRRQKSEVLKISNPQSNLFLFFLMRLALGDDFLLHVGGHRIVVA